MVIHQHGDRYRENGLGKQLSAQCDNDITRDGGLWRFLNEQTFAPPNHLATV